MGKVQEMLEVELHNEMHSTKIADSKKYLITKRLTDIVLAAFGMFLCSPFFIVLAILIKLEDPKGSVFFRQIRIGYNGKPFYMYKFRSMISNAEQLLEKLLHHNEASGAMFKIKNDPRITKVGRFIRKTSIDELPQLWNVLKGEMSLVGPRPPLPREVEQYNDYHKQRLFVKPGCTGLWQVSGRSNTGFDKMIDLDLRYIEQRNIFYDFKLILITIAQLIIAKDAY